MSLSYQTWHTLEKSNHYFIFWSDCEHSFKCRPDERRQLLRALNQFNDGYNKKSDAGVREKEQLAARSLCRREGCRLQGAGWVMEVSCSDHGRQEKALALSRQNQRETALARRLPLRSLALHCTLQHFPGLISPLNLLRLGGACRKDAGVINRQVYLIMYLC